MNRVKIGDKLVGKGEPSYIIAEAGLNHNGDIKLAMQLIEVAAEANVDAVKFQKRDIRELLTEEAYNRPYQNANSFGPTYGLHREKLELTDAQFEELAEHAKSMGLTFLSSGWDEKSVKFLDRLVPAHKVPSANLTCTPLLEFTAKLGKPVILSTGMSTLEEIEIAVGTILEHNKDLILLHCTATYPSDFSEINLNAIRMLKDKFGVPVGYSGHERGICVSEAAVVAGAVMVERHFTLDRTLPGPDHVASLEPAGLKKMVRDIRNIEKAVGKPEKIIFESEKPIREKLAKSIVSSREIPKGAAITRGMLSFKCPGSGIPPYKLDSVLNKRAKKCIKADTIIRRGDLE